MCGWWALRRSKIRVVSVMVYACTHTHTHTHTHARTTMPVFFPHSASTCILCALCVCVCVCVCVYVCTCVCVCHTGPLVAPVRFSVVADTSLVWQSPWVRQTSTLHPVSRGFDRHTHTHLTRLLCALHLRAHMCAHADTCMCAILRCFRVCVCVCVRAVLCASAPSSVPPTSRV